MNIKLTLAICAIAMCASAERLTAATLDAKGVVVNGKTVCEIERRDFADGWALRYVLPEGGRRIGFAGLTPLVG